MEEDIILREKEKSLHMSRVPKNLKEEFVKLANAEFTGDFGLCFKWCFDQAMEYQYMKSALFNGYLVKDHKKKKKEEHSLTMLSGKKINLKGGTNGLTK